MPYYPEITIGMGINWYTQSLLNNYAWQVRKTNTITYVVDPPIVLSRTDMEMFDNFRAYNFTFGLLWDAYEKQDNLLTFGLVYHTPFTARVDWELHSTSTSGSSFIKEDFDIDFPASLGAGVNYRFSSSLSAAFDVEWKEWSKFAQKYADGTRTSPVGDDTLAYRLGGEHLFLEGARERESLIACRGGVFYEPRPLAGYPDSVPVYGFSVGLGWTLRDQFSLDFAYQYRWGEEDLGNIDYRIEEQFFVASLIKYF
jgi:long-subunit fatty acid transport protein